MENHRFSQLYGLGCAICKSPNPHIHHLMGYKYKGMGQKADDKFTIPLCYKHHVGEEGIHTLGIQTWEDRYGSQEHHLEITNKYLVFTF